MKLSLRWRISLTLVPLLLLLAVLGSAGAMLLYRLGGRIDAILRENYESVVAMESLQEALERIDSSFQFMLVARGLQDPKERAQLEERARMDYARNWVRYEEALEKEQDNITIHPTESELVERLTVLTTTYRRQGREFHDRSPQAGLRHEDYYGANGLYATFAQIKDTADDILRLNQNEMKEASERASRTALNSLIWFGVGLAAAVLLAGLLAWHTVRNILQPIRAVTESAQGISAGNLNQVVPVLSRDELGQLAEAFNLMARHLRDLRLSQSAQLLRAQRTSQATIDSFPDPVMVIDAEGCVEMANPAARRLLGVAPLTLPSPPSEGGEGRVRGQRGQPAAATWQPPEPLRLPLAEALQGHSDYLPEGFDRTILMGSNGYQRSVLPRILTIRDPYGNTLGAAVLLQDVTRLRLLDQMKSNLVATASHELKTPLTSIRLAVHLLLEEAAGPLAPKQTELLLDARDNCERLLTMVNNLLDLARIEQGWRQLKIQPEAPEELLRAAADAFQPRAQDRGVELVVEVPPGLPPVAVDAVRLGHALRNLLDNALTYTDRGGRVTLAAAASGDTVTLSVADTGCGIPPEHLPHVFEKFFRVPGQSRGSGTGLGLAIVNEIVTAHGGTVTCASEPSAGTVFRIALPVALSS